MKKLSECRTDFPSLKREHNGRPLVYLDGPAGSQIPQSVIEGISDYYKTCNANTHGQFITTNETDDLMSNVRHKMATFLGAESATDISFGQNMTTLCYSLSRAIGRTLTAGDEVLITQLDHEANWGPWLSLEQLGIVVKEVEMLPKGVLDYSDFEQKVNERTKLVAVGYASNLTGTINDVRMARQLADKVGALLVIDAVHYAPHFPIDVNDLGCDFLLCSAYKFYGPHVGVLYSKPGALDNLPTDRLITQEQTAPYLIETGTLNHAAFAGAGAAIDFIESFGEGHDKRARIVNAMTNISYHEQALGKRLYDGLLNIEGIIVKGLDFSQMNRTPTVSFYKEGITAEEICKQLGAKSICGWDGHFYAQRAVEKMGLLDKGGVTRLGVSIYTTEEEIDYTVEVIREIL